MSKWFLYWISCIYCVWTCAFLVLISSASSDGSGESTSPLAYTNLDREHQAKIGFLPRWVHQHGCLKTLLRKRDQYRNIVHLPYYAKTQPPSNLGPLSARPQNAIRMAFRWRADSCPILRAVWERLISNAIIGIIITWDWMSEGSLVMNYPVL